MARKYSYSMVECFESCKRKFRYRYIDKMKALDDDSPVNPLILGRTIHKGIEKDVESAVKDYVDSYPIITDKHVDEIIKLEHLIPEVKKVLPDGLHEVRFENEIFKGFIDLLVPCTKYDAQLPHGQFDLYDFKYSNSVDRYMESKQLHVYKWQYEKITGKHIRKMYLVFIPKTFIRQKQDETLFQFRQRLKKELSKMNVTIEPVEFDKSKTGQFLVDMMKIGLEDEYPKNETKLCDWCEYQKYCKEGINYMIELPKAGRRQPGQETKRTGWIYGGPFSGKTTFMDKAPAPLNLNTDGNIKFVTQQYVPIKDTWEGRQKILAWKNFKDTVDELEKTAGQNGFKTIIVDLLEDTYEACRLYMYDKLGITHESDDSFRAWDKVRTEFLSTIRKLMNLDYENIFLISHEDMSKDITKKSGDKITAIKPNINDKVASKVAGMVDIVARVVVEDDGSRTLNFKSNEVVFGGGRLKNVKTTTIPLDWDELVKVYNEANNFFESKAEEIQNKENSTVEEETKKTDTFEPVKEERSAEAKSEAVEEPTVQEAEVVEKPVRKRRTRKVRE